MKVSPTISMQIVKVNYYNYLDTLDKMADSFELDVETMIDEINDLGVLINGVYAKNGKAYALKKGRKRVYSPIDAPEELLKIGIEAYRSLEDDSDYCVVIFDGETERRWYPSHAYMLPEEMEEIWKGYDWGDRREKT